MIKNNYPGKLIVIEGLDGAGTTTQAAQVDWWLRVDQKIDTCLTAEPSRGPIGSLIRSVLTKRLSMDHLTLAGMYASDRLDHIYNEKNGLINKLKSGTWVILDRYYLSSFAYQASQITENQQSWLLSIHQPCLIPDLTIFLDVPVDTCLNRIAVNRHKQFELFERKSLLKSIEKQYNIAIDYFSQNGETIIRLNGTQEIAKVQEDMRNTIRQYLLV